MIELYVNGLLIDGVDVIKMTRAVNDIGELPTRQGDYSNTIEIPATKENLKNLGYVESVNTVIKQVESPCEVYQDGVLVFEGNLKVLAVKETIQALIVSGNSIWYNAIKDKPLRALDVSEYNHVYNEAEIESLRTSTTGYVYPNISKSTTSMSTVNELNWYDFLGCFYIEYIIQKIFNQAGYNVVYPLVDEITKGIIISKDGGFTIVPNSGLIIAEGVNDAFLPTATFTGPVFGTYLGIDVVSDNADYIFPNAGTTTNLNTCSYFVSRVDGFYDISISVNFTAAGFGLDPTASITIKERNTGNALRTENFGFVNGVNNNINIFFPGTLNFKLNQEYVFDFSVNNAGTISNMTFDVTFLAIEIIPFTNPVINVSRSPLKNYTYSVANSLPDISQSDFLIDLFVRLCIFCSTNNINNTVTLVTFEQLLDGIDSASDWTDYADLSEQPEILYDFFDSYSNQNILKAASANSYFEYLDLTSNFTNGVFTIPEKEGTAEIYTSDFINVERVSDFAMYPLLTFDMENAYGIVDITTDNLVKQKTQATPTHSAEVFGESFRLQNNIIKYYPKFISVIRTGVAIKMLFKLPRALFTAINFTSPIYLNLQTESHGQIRGHFYINEIDQWQAGESCYVTLVKID